MNNSKQALAIAIAGTVASATAAFADMSAEPAVPTYSAIYRVEHDHKVVGQSSVSVSFDAAKQTYRYDSELHLTGAYRLLIPHSISMSSEFEVDNGVVVPLVYSRKGGRSADEAFDVRFDWTSHTADLAGRTIELGAGSVDPSSLNVATMLAMLTHSDNNAYTVVDEDGAKHYNVSVDSSASAAHPLVQANTIRVTYGADQSDKSIVMTVAPELCFLPVTIERQDAGVATSLVLESVEGLQDDHAICPSS